MKKILKSNSGITLIEMITAVVIIGIAASMAVPRFQIAIERMNFRSANREVISILREARSLAISTRSAHGVYVDEVAGEIVLYKEKGTSEDLYEDGVDSVVATEDFAGVDGVSGDQLDYVVSNFASDVVLFYPNGSAKNSGIIWTIIWTQDVFGAAIFEVAQATGKIDSYWESYTLDPPII